MRVIHHERKRLQGHFSIERLFAQIRNHMPQEIVCERVACPKPSKGIFARIWNMLNARAASADVHHVVGDVHYLVLTLPRKRTILTIHDCASLLRASGLRRLLLKLFWFVLPLTRASVATTISQFTKKELQRCVGKNAEAIRVIPNCVGSEFRHLPKPFNAERPIVLQVGTLWNKNVERVVQALEGIPCLLEIIGGLDREVFPEHLGPKYRGRTFRNLRHFIESTGVTFKELGALNDAELLESYNRADIVVFASLYEGFGLPVVEAQAVGRPVVTSNVAAMPEVAGNGALFVDPTSVKDIREALRKIITDETVRERLIQNGKENASRYSGQAVAEKYAELYREIHGE